MHRPLALSALLLLGCPSAADPPSNDDDATEAASSIQVEGPSTTQPLVVDFGEVVIGSFETADVVVTNVGDEDLEVEEAQRGNTEVLYQDDELPAVLAPGASTTISLQYAPTFQFPNNGPLDTTLTVVSSDPVTPEVELAVRGEGVRPEIAFDPTGWDFGQVPIGQQGSFELTLKNEGTGGLDVTAIELIDEDTDAVDEFSMTGVPEVPFRVLPGGERSWMVHYQTEDVQPDSARVEVSSNDPQRAVGSVEVFGIGVVDQR